MILLQIHSNEAGQRFDKYLKKLLKNAPTSFLYKMLRKKNIVLNGKKAQGKEQLSIGDEVTLFFSDETYQKFSGAGAVPGQAQCGGLQACMPYIRAFRELGALPVVFENEHILVVNKPAGVLSQKAKPADVSLNEWLIGYLLEQGAVSPQTLATFKPSVCNRLDRNTSGMVVCGKSLSGSQYMGGIIRNRTLEKYYCCIVYGKSNLNGRLSGYLYKDHTQNTVQVFATVEDMPAALRRDADFIDTAFSTIEAKENVSFIEAQLFTGRTHQIRAHLAALGHPVVGDFKYGAPKGDFENLYEIGVRHQLLHAHKLVFPFTSDARFSDLSGLTLDCGAPEPFEIIMKEG